MSFEVLIPAAKIHTRVQELGREITEHYKAKGVEKLVVLGVLKGSFMFLADLVRAIELPLEIEFIEVSSYGAETTSSGTVNLVRDILVPLDGQDVLVVEDIIDTGRTLYYLLEHLQRSHRPKSAAVCTLLYKPARQVKPLTIDYKGFTIQDHFVVGYGLDFNNRYRQFADIVEFKEPQA